MNIILLLCTPDYWTGYIEHYCVHQTMWTGYIEHRCIRQTMWTGYTEHYCVRQTMWTGYIEHRCVHQTIGLDTLYTIHGLDYWTRLWNRAW